MQAIKICFFFSDLKEKISTILNQNPDSHFFMDEVPLGCGITAEELAEVSKQIHPYHCLWIACQSQLNPSPEDLRDFGKCKTIVEKMVKPSY